MHLRSLYILPIFLLLLPLLMACSKKHFSTKPRGKFVSATPLAVSLARPVAIHEGEPKALSLTYNFQDDDGNINDISLTKKILNVRAVEPTTFKRSIPLNVSWPSVNKKNSLRGKINFLLSYIEIGGPTRVNIDDTVRFILVLKDKDGKESDSIFSEPITILRSGR